MTARMLDKTLAHTDSDNPEHTMYAASLLLATQQDRYWRRSSYLFDKSDPAMEESGYRNLPQSKVLLPISADDVPAHFGYTVSEDVDESSLWLDSGLLSFAKTRSHHLSRGQVDQYIDETVRDSTFFVIPFREPVPLPGLSLRDQEIGEHGWEVLVGRVGSRFRDTSAEDYGVAFEYVIGAGLQTSSSRTIGGLRNAGYSDAAERLRYLDGLGSQDEHQSPIDYVSVSNAARFLKLVEPFSGQSDPVIGVDRPAIWLDEDGSLSLQWQNDNRSLVVYIDCRVDGDVEYSVLAENFVTMSGCDSVTDVLESIHPYLRTL